MSRQIFLLVTLASTIVGFLGGNNNLNLLAQPSPNSSFEKTQTGFSDSLPSSEPLSEQIEGIKIQEYGELQKSSFNPKLEKLDYKVNDDSTRFFPVTSVPERRLEIADGQLMKYKPLFFNIGKSEIYSQPSTINLKSSIYLQAPTYFSRGDNLQSFDILTQEVEENSSTPLESTLGVDPVLPKKTAIRLLDSCSQDLGDPNSSYLQNLEAQKLIPSNNSCLTKPSLRASDLDFTQREEKLTASEIFSQSSIAEENSAEPNSESDLGLPISSSQEIDSENDEGWQFKFQPFAPIPITAYGNATVKNRRVDYHLSLGKVLDILRVTASGRFEAWKGDWGFIVSAYYISLRGSGIREFTRFPNLTLKETLKFDQGTYDFVLSYRFGDRPQYSSPEQPSNQSFPLVYFEPMIGTRLNDIYASIDAELDFGTLGRTKLDKFERGRTWFEPLVGGKLGMQVSEPITLWVRGDASGFGLAGETDMSWNVSFGGDWRVSRLTSLQLGYYFYHIDYENGSGNNTFGFESNQNGPYLSATFHF